MPFLLQIVRQGSKDFSSPLPNIGGFYLAAIAICLVLGAVASYAFRAHHPLAAIYHGATAPITLAFVIGFDVHGG